MFVRKKKNRSGIISIQIIDKSTGSYKVIKTMGSSANEQEVQRLFEEGQCWIRAQSRQASFDFLNEEQLFPVSYQALSRFQLRVSQCGIQKKVDADQ